MTSTATLNSTGTAWTGGITWSTVSNAIGAPDSAYAVLTNGSAGASAQIAVGGHGAQTAIGTQPGSIDSVAVTVTWHCATVSRWASVTVLFYDDNPDIGAPIGVSQALTLSTVSTNVQTLTFTGSNCPTWAQLANLYVFIEATKAGSTSSTVSVDAASIVVTYTPAASPAAGLASGTGTAYQATSATPGATNAAAGLASGTGTAPVPALTGVDAPPPPVPPGWVGTSGVVAASGASPPAITPCAETQPGDLLVYHFFGAASDISGTESLDLLAGWSWVRTNVVPGLGGVAAVAIRVCMAGDTSFSWVIHNFPAGTTVAAWIDTWRGQDATAPVTGSSAAGWTSGTALGGFLAPVPAQAAPGDIAVIFAGQATQFTGQDLLSGDGLTWMTGLLQYSALGGGATVAQQFGVNPHDAGGAANITGKTITISGAGGAADGDGIFYVVHMDPAGVAFRAGFVPVQVNATTGSVTGAWASGQVTQSGNLLAAAVTAEATTTAAAISTPAGWVKTGEAAGTSVRAAYYTRTAAGSDAAPAFTSALSGAAQGMTATLYELTGALLSAPVAASGTATGTTANPLTVTTTGSVPSAGCLALSCHAAFQAAGANTWTKDAAWTNDTTNGATSQSPHAACDHLSSPVAGPPLADGGTWATAPTAEAAMSIVIAPQPSPGNVTIRGAPGFDGAGATATVSSRAPAITAGTRAGELMAAACCWSGAVTLTTPPAGWTLLHSTVQTNDNLAVYYRYFVPGDAAPAFALSAACTCIACCITFSGAATSGAPVAANVLGGAASTTATYPAITPANATDLLVYLPGLRPATASLLPVLSTLPAGGTGGAVIQVALNSTNVSGAAESALGILTQQLTAATAVAQETSTVSTSSSCDCEALCIAAAPYPGGAARMLTAPAPAVMQASTW